MREGIHPAYYQAKVVCNCGNEFVTGSTKEEIHVEICSKCHPFYTGQQKATSARDVLISSTRSMVLITSYEHEVEVVKNLNFFTLYVFNKTGGMCYETIRYRWTGCY